jgi:hypothetical protein
LALLQQRAAAGALQDTEVHFSACALTSSDDDGDTYDYNYDDTVATSNTAGTAAVSGSSIGGSSGAASGGSNSSRRRHSATAAKEKCKDTVGKLLLPLHTTKLCMCKACAHCFTCGCL